MQAKCNVDVAGFGQKPNKGQIGAIKGRLGFSRAEVTPEELAGYIQQGRSWTPAELKGTKKEDWLSQQIIAVDVDNADKDGKRIDEPVTPEQAREVYGAAGLAPTFMHYSFSNKPGWPKFRIVFFLDKVIEDRETAEELSRRAINVLETVRPGSTDKKCFNGDRLFFGGKPGSVFFTSGDVVKLSTLEALPASGYEEEPQEETPAPAAAPEPMPEDAGPQGRAMSIDEAIKEVKPRWRDILPKYTTKATRKVNGETSYICPFCGHGAHGDGLTFNKKSQAGAYSLKCFGPCDFSGDIIAFVEKLRGVGFVEALRMCCEDIGIALEARKGQQDGGAFGFDDVIPAEGQADAWEPAGATESPQDAAEDAKAEESPQEPAETPQGPTEADTGKTDEKPDFKPYLKRAYMTLRGDEGAWAREYEERRGISRSTLVSFGCGYDPAGDPANAPGAMTDAYKKYPAGYMIFPNNNGGYSARRIDGREECEKINVSPVGLFPANALKRDRPGGVIFVTEGPNDAMSIHEAGYCALALCSASNARTLLDALEREPLVEKPLFMLSLDNDAAGNKCRDDLKAGLQKLGYSYFVANVSGKYKDPNEALIADRDVFCLDVARAVHRSTSKKPHNTSWYVDNLMSEDIKRFGQPVPTGFPGLDKKFGGGLHPGVYILGAVPSLGKSTLLLQMADQIAAGGHDVLIFSLEMSRLELVSKSLARITAQQTSLATAPVSLEIRKNKLTSAVLAAAETYKKQVGDRISVFEGNFSCTLPFMRQQVERYIEDTGVKPVCILDYLQVLQQEEGKQRKPVREFITDAANEIEKLAKSLSLPFVVVSSLNRQNYLLPFDYESLKESGGLEYTADCVLGLQLSCINEEMFGENKTTLKAKRDRVNAAKNETPRRVELVALKNRFGEPHFSHGFDYYSRNDLFIEHEEKTETTASKPARKGAKK